jgi:hypothetical protein
LSIFPYFQNAPFLLYYNEMSITSLTLSRIEYVLLGCFGSLVFTLVIVWMNPSQSTELAQSTFYQQDDDCDGIPNFRDARFNKDSYDSCSFAATKYHDQKER